jgi:mono/diheme cytochrome c family protein
MTRTLPLAALGLAAACLTVAPSASGQSPAPRVEFNRDVRPILSDACFACHGPDASKRKAKLRLDDRANAIDKGAIVPGKPGESELIARLLLPEADEGHMPPKESHKTLSKKQIETLKTWVEQGAEYQAHWAYIPPKPFTVPAHQFQGEQPIDRFVLAELEKVGVGLSKEADRRTLIRRLTLDLTGLPPTPAEVEAFVGDKSPNAYEKIVNRLLASPHFGERMATPWLDLVRFADTVGYHGDQNQRIFPYRDYVIESFNTNKPFDVFTREQIAGDLLPNATKEQLVATGFHRLNMMTREGGAQPKEYLAKYQADRVRTVSMAWLGSTMGCCECHDHKFDPFTAKDFYSMSAFFADLRQWGVYSDYNYTPNPDLKGWNNDFPFPPEIEVDNPALKRRVATLSAQLAALNPAAKKELIDQWIRNAGEILALGHGGWAQHDDVELEGKPKKDETHDDTIEKINGWVASVRLNLLPTFDFAGKITRDGKPANVTFSVAKKAKDGKVTKLPLAFGAANPPEVITRYSSTAPVNGLPGGAWRTNGEVSKPHAAVWLLDSPTYFGEGDELVATVKCDNLSAFRVDISPFGFTDVNDPRTPTDGNGLNGVLLGTGHDKETFARSKAIRRELLDLRGGKAWTQVAVSQTPITTRIFPRGNWMDETGPVVTPAVPAFLGGPKPKDGKPLTRLDLADWLVSKDNPLTARVFANRMWKLFFGNGLSANLEDVGGQGEPPSHPELLDWLAVEFTKKWDVKALVKTMVMSRTYRQTSTARPELKDKDPGNRLLSYQNPRRLEAEFVRDNALAIAGLLNKDLGGPSVKPYQPDGYYGNLQFPDRPYKAEVDDRQYRRGLYVHWQRTFLHPMLANFDAPSREECLCNRTTANTPQQALTLLNDPSFVEAARVLAANLVTDDHFTTDQGRLDWLFKQSLARSPNSQEKDSLTKFLIARRAEYKANPKDAERMLLVGNAPTPKAIDPAELAAWTAVCRVVLNLHETITRY